MTSGQGLMTADQGREVVATAVHAPSVHNTQPWLFAVDGDVVQVRADRTRQLAEQDPNGRELMISCGGAVLHAMLGVRALGRACERTWLPEPADPDLVARLRAGAALDLTPDERRLLEAVALRHTDRSAFAAEPVPETLVDQLRLAVEAEGCWLLVPQRSEDVVELEVLVASADSLLRQDAALSRETAAWVRPGEHPAQGLPTGALPDHGEGRGSSLTLRDFDPESAPAGAAVAPDADPPAAERPLLLVLGTDADSPADWLQAGAALARALLVATGAGLVANPQTAVMEVPALREQLTARLRVVGRPQLLLRVGWPSGPGSPQTGRRPLDDVTLPAKD